jgi:hypothetical protein
LEHEVRIKKTNAVGHASGMAKESFIKQEQIKDTLITGWEEAVSQ